MPVIEQAQKHKNGTQNKKHDKKTMFLQHSHLLPTTLQYTPGYARAD
jgi:hypothetical protein